MELRITLPEDYGICFGERDPNLLEAEMKKNNALILYKQGKISLSKSAELASMSIYEFIAECKKTLSRFLIIRRMRLMLKSLK